MAMAPPRTCPVPKCGRVNCQVHRPTDWRPRYADPAIRRMRGRQLQQARVALFGRQPWCQACVKEGRYNVRATIRDHVIPLAEGGRDDVTNEQALCLDCSNAKTARESQRGVARGAMR